ncbi:MAG TPA: cytochrome c oxidase assembly protein [Thermoanaerobaculia bacterium]
MRISVPLCALCVSVVIVSPLHAHEGEVHAPDAWSIATAISLVLIACLYAIGIRPLWRKAIRPWQATAFALGWASAAAALLSPLDRWSDVLFSAHMAQHEILMLVSAPLMVAGRPYLAALHVLPPLARFARAGELVTGPVTVLVLHAVVLWVWHIPALFEAALHDETIHVIQHLGFFLTAALFWFALLHGRYGRLGYGVGVFYVFLTAMHTEILGALLTFASRVWYPTHAARTAAAGGNAVDDQQLAGVLMWIPFGVVFVFIGLALFAAWLGEAERRVAFTSAGRIARR